MSANLGLSITCKITLSGNSLLSDDDDSVVVVVVVVVVDDDDYFSLFLIDFLFFQCSTDLALHFFFSNLSSVTITRLTFKSC